MNAVITADQRQALAATKEGCLRLTDPETHEVFVLVKAEAYDRLQGLLADETIFTSADVLDRVMEIETLSLKPHFWSGEKWTIEG
jgi:hypothetical protein